MYKRGDTLIEVMFAVAVFGLGAVGAIALMNTGLASVQNSLETTMARQEIDAQAEALRFIHDAYLTEPNTKSTDGTTGEEISTNNFRNLWQDIVAQAYPPSTVSTSGSYSGGVVSEDPDFFTRTVDNKSNCDTLFTTSTSNSSFGIPSQSFIINPRGLNLLTEKDSATGNTKVLSHTDIRQNILISAKDTYSSFTTAATYPRLLYGTSNTTGESLTDAFIENNAIKYKSAVTRLDSSEGIWVTAITSNSGLQCYDENGNPEGGIRPDFYDFHIQTCWDSISGNASVISSTVRLFNPDQVNLRKQGMITFDNVEWEKYDNNTNHQGPCSGSDPPEHVITNGTDIEFVGYTRDNMDEGVKYSIADRLYFTLDVDVDTSGILTHPGGKGLTITIGPIEANLTDSGGTITGSESKTVDARTFHLQMVRAGNHYTACADSICVEADSDATDVSIDYNFKHNGHCCSAISRAKLSNIDMTSNEIDDQTTGGCVRVTPTVTEQEAGGIGGGDDGTAGPGEGPGEQSKQDVEPAQDPTPTDLANYPAEPGYMVVYFRDDCSTVNTGTNYVLTAKLADGLHQDTTVIDHVAYVKDTKFVSRDATPTSYGTHTSTRDGTSQMQHDVYGDYSSLLYTDVFYAIPEYPTKRDGYILDHFESESRDYYHQRFNRRGWMRDPAYGMGYDNYGRSYSVYVCGVWRKAE